MGVAMMANKKTPFVTFMGFARQQTTQSIVKQFFTPTTQSIVKQLFTLILTDLLYLYTTYSDGWKSTSGDFVLTTDNRQTDCFTPCACAWEGEGG